MPHYCLTFYPQSIKLQSGSTKVCFSCSWSNVTLDTDQLSSFYTQAYQ